MGCRIIGCFLKCFFLWACKNEVDVNVRFSYTQTEKDTDRQAAGSAHFRRGAEYAEYEGLGYKRIFSVRILRGNALILLLVRDNVIKLNNIGYCSATNVIKIRHRQCSL